MNYSFNSDNRYKDDGDVVLAEVFHYTYYAYFKNADTAAKAAAALGAEDFRVKLVADEWQLQAVVAVDEDSDWHAEPRKIVNSLGGQYDGGEAGFPAFAW